MASAGGVKSTKVVPVDLDSSFSSPIIVVVESLSFKYVDDLWRAALFLFANDIMSAWELVGTNAADDEGCAAKQHRLRHDTKNADEIDGIVFAFCLFYLCWSGLADSRRWKVTGYIQMGNGNWGGKR